MLAPFCFQKYLSIYNTLIKPTKQKHPTNQTSLQVLKEGRGFILFHFLKPVIHNISKKAKKKEFFETKVSLHIHYEKNIKIDFWMCSV